MMFPEFQTIFEGFIDDEPKKSSEIIVIKKTCPLAIGNRRIPCLEERCSWWTPYNECAIVNIAHMIGNASDKIEPKPKSLSGGHNDE